MRKREHSPFLPGNFLFLLGRRSLAKPNLILRFVISNRIRIKFGKIVLQVNMHLGPNRRSRISEITSYFQDGGHNVRPPLRVQFPICSSLAGLHYFAGLLV